MFNTSVCRALFALVATASIARAEVVRVDVASRRPLLGGQSFGTVGAYEIITGTIHYAVNPRHPRNAIIVDLDLAPRNAAGRVEFAGDIVILRPLDPTRGNGITLIDVVNRGGRTVLGIANRASQGDFTAPQHVGDGLLLERGYTIAFVGWEFDVRAGARLRVPSATGVTGFARGIHVPSAPTQTLVFNDLAGYTPIDAAAAENTLTVRDGQWGTPNLIPRAEWRLSGDSVVLSMHAQPGRMYELAYLAKDPPVAGLGFAAIRDVASWTKSQSNTLAPNRLVVAFGNSQSGRFLRDFLYQGFNTDEQEARALDGVFANIAGSARIDLNRRWATPVSGSYHTATSYPFADSALADHASGAREGMLDNRRILPASRPKVFYTNSAAEYWGGARAAALLHVTPDGTSDIAPPPTTRIYFIAGTQHGAGAFPPVAGSGRALGNPTSASPVIRALFVAMEAWVRDNVEPPASRYPRLSDGTLVRGDALRFPELPGVVAPPRADAGSRVANPLIPNSAAGTPIPLLVPQVDADGNELAGVRLPSVAVPLATLTGWNYRNPQVGAPSELFPQAGSYIPFARTKADRDAARDPRPAALERYADEARFLDATRAAAAQLVADGYMLERDMPFVMARAKANWQLVVPSP